jgi:hypothetical protein
MVVNVGYVQCSGVYLQLLFAGWHSNCRLLIACAMLTVLKRSRHAK